jgi:hypothetical protein
MARGPRSDHPLTGFEDDSYPHTEVFKAAIYSVLPSLNVEGNSPRAGERPAGTAELTVLQNDGTDPIYVCPVSGRVTWARPYRLGKSP